MNNQIRMPRGRNQMSYYGQCPDSDMPPMGRGPMGCFDNCSRMDGHCGMGTVEFKPPMMNVEPQPPPAKKKRRSSAAASAAAQPPTSAAQDLCPPPLSGFGDTIVASNPFDDTPSIPPMPHMNPMNHVNKHMAVNTCISPAGPPMMGSRSPCHTVGSPVGCGPPVGSPINCGPSMGNCSPMSNAGNYGPIGSPHGCNSRQLSRSPLVGPPISTSSVMSNSPMNMNSMMPMNSSPSSLGSPISSTVSSNVRVNSPLDCGIAINSVGSQKGSPMSMMAPHSIGSQNCSSPIGSPSNLPLNACNTSNMSGSPIPSPLSNAPCTMSGGSDLSINLNGPMNRSPHRAPPTSISGGPMMCNSQGPPPMGMDPMSRPMSMNCSPNPSMMSMNMKPDMSMSELGMRQNCGPGHLPMKPNNGPGFCRMPVSGGPYARPPQMGGMQCGPMNSPHCGPMMSNHCGPSMNHGPCMVGINRFPCPPNVARNMPFDGMSPQQFRPSMNRSHFFRGMGGGPYGPNVMNGPMNGPHVNMPVGNAMNGAGMGGMCGISELNTLAGCGPSGGNAAGIQCMGEQPPPSMGGMHCMTANTMNQCPPMQPPASMFNSPYGPFDGNNPRGSPNLHFNQSMNGNFYRPAMSNPASALCMPNMQQSVGASANDILELADCAMNGAIISKNDSSTIDSDIASMVCSITNNASDDLNLLEDELLRDIKPEEQQCKSMRDFDNDLLLRDSVAEAKDELAGKGCAELDAKGDDESKRKSALPEKHNGSSPNSVTNASSAASMMACAGSANDAATANGADTPAPLENGEIGSCGSIASVRSADGVNLGDEFVFKAESGSVGGSETLGNSSVHSNHSEGLALEEAASDEKIKNEPMDEKMLEQSNAADEKNAGKSGSDGAGCTSGGSDGDGDAEAGADKDKSSEAAAGVKIENEDFFDDASLGKGRASVDGGLGKNDCAISANDIEPGSNGYTGPGALLRNGPPAGFNASAPNSMAADMMANSIPCMNDVLCDSPTMVNVNRAGMPPNSMNHAMNFPNDDMCKQVYPATKSKVFDSQNPNAPPIYACGKCHKGISDDDQAILCESGCHFWFHRQCSGLIEIAYQFLTSEIYAEWACDTCLSTKNIPLVKYKS